MAEPLLLMTLYSKPKTPTITKLVSKREQGINEQLLKTELMFFIVYEKNLKKQRGGGNHPRRLVRLRVKSGFP